MTQVAGRTLAIAALAAATGNLAATARADNATVRKSLEATYRGISTAFQKRDLAALMAPLAPGYTLRQPNGQTSARAQVEAEFKQMMTATQSSTWTRHIDRLSVSGTSAVATVTGYFKGKMAGRDGKPHTFTMTAVTRDTWTYAAGKWLLQRSAVVSNQMQMDGKAMAGGR